MTPRPWKRGAGVWRSIIRFWERQKSRRDIPRARETPAFNKAWRRSARAAGCLSDKGLRGTSRIINSQEWAEERRR